MTITFENMFSAIDISLLLSGLEGIYLAKSRRSKWFQTFQWVYFVIAYINLIPCAFFEAVFAWLEDRSIFGEWILKVSELTTCVIVCFLCVLKTAYLIRKKTIIVDKVEKFRQLWPTEENPKDFETAQEYMASTKKFIFIYTILTNAISFVYNLFPLFNMLLTYIKEKRKILLMPYFIWYPFEVTSSNTVYSVVYISQFFAGLFTTAGVTGFDTILCVMVAMLSMQFRLLCEKLENMTKNCSQYSKQELTENLKHLVEKHDYLIRLSKEVESIFGFVLLVNLLGCTFQLCLILFSIMIAPFERLFKYIIFLMSTLTQIFMFSWYGDSLLENSSLVSTSVYNSDWVDIDDISYKKSLILLQVRAQNSVGISVMGFTTLSLKSLTSILSASWSYFTLLRTLYKDIE